MKPFLVIVHVLVISNELCLASLGFASGPSRVLFPGDFESFSCVTKGTHNATWEYNFNDKKSEVVSNSDILQNEETQAQGSLSRTSLIRIRKNLKSVFCLGDSLTPVSDVDVDVLDLAPVDLLKEPSCNSSPEVIMKRWDGFSFNRIWVPHYVANKEVFLSSAVTGIKLTCVSSKRMNWTISEKSLENFRYWTGKKNGCFLASLVIYQMNPTASQRFTCTQGPSGNEDVFVDVKYSPTRMTDGGEILDFNKTQECIEFLGTTVFGNQTLAWTTTGSSVLSIGMMVGIVFLKKQLNKQKETNSATSTSTS